MMMKKLISFLFSMLFTGILVVIFAIAIGYATFIENDYGTVTAKVLIYNACWFEFLFLLLAINLVGSIFKNKLIQQKRWAGILLHISFIIIVAGSALTRYIGYEGMMHIRENESSNIILSEPTFIRISAIKGSETVISEKQVMFSPYTANRYSDKLDIGGQTIHIKNLGFMPSAEEVLVPDPSGVPIVSVVAVEHQMNRNDFVLNYGDSKKIGGMAFGFNSLQNPGIELSLQNGTLFLKCKDTLLVMEMAGMPPATIKPDSLIEVNTQKAYSVGSLSFAVKQYLSKGVSKLQYIAPQGEEKFKDAFQAEISSGSISKVINVFGAKGALGEPFSTNIDGIDVTVTYGSKNIEIPFSIHLNDFQLERYPGSNSPSSYASEVVLKDGSIEKPFRIYMNNILKYKGFRFFQSSYDHDEQGTYLTVNHDWIGTSVTYAGYLMLAIGMIWIFFNKNSRIKSLMKSSGKLRQERKKLFAVVILALFLGLNANAQNPDYSKNLVSEFGKMLVQSPQGRIEPVSTISSEIVRKVTKKSTWNGINPTAMFLDMQANPATWQAAPIIKIGNSDIRRMLNASENYVSFSMMFDQNTGAYKLQNQVTASYEKKANERNKFDKEIINIDERVNVLMQVFSGKFMTIFPVPGDQNHKWVSLDNANLLGKEGEPFARNSLTGFFAAAEKKDNAMATALLGKLKQYQEKEGAKIIPSKSKVNSEILYNNLNLFGKLSKIYLLIGLIMLVMNLVTIFNPKTRLTKLKKPSLILISALFLIHTFGLGIRWYISGHAPWSNGYESMVFISWATCLAGIIFGNRSEITLSMTTLLAGLSLLVAGFSWMNPEITPLVPVLKSYWLIVHVAVITSSYGFLGVGALLGMMNLILMILRNRENTQRVNLTIRELVNIIDIALIIGLILVTLGSFLGGVWANESWGRYWGWDPKETWALVTVLVYTFISHMHKIPGFKGNFALSAAALVGFGSVLMTYFGVNYYLSGMHSYAQGDPPPVPVGVYIAIVVVLLLIVLAYFAEKKIKSDS